MKYVIVICFLLFLVSCKSEVSKSISIKEDVVFLSDDALEGMQTGTNGEKVAA